MINRLATLLMGTIVSLPLLTGCARGRTAQVPPPQPVDAFERFGESDMETLDADLAALMAYLSVERDFLPDFLDVPLDTAMDDVEDKAIDLRRQANERFLGHAGLLEMLSRSHPMVEKWIEYFTTRGRDQYARFLGRLYEHGGLIQSWLKDENVPPELIWLAFIESGVNPRAYSSAHAAGIWQFISSTGRVYGLKRDFWVDDRRDPVRSTRAAARHLRDLYERYENWELAFSAYNAGPRRVERAVRYAGTSDYWRMVHRRYALPRETRNYVPKLIAAFQIAQDLPGYGFGAVTAASEPPWETIEIPGGLPIKAVARQLNIPETDLRTMNRHLRRAISPPSETSYINIPTGHAEPLQAWIDAGDLPLEDWGDVYIVRRGDTLWEIAQAYGSSVYEIRSLNNMRSSRIYPGQQLIVPLASGGGGSASVVDGKVTVRRGDSLSQIARRTGVPIATIKALNGLKSNTIHPGQVLLVYAEPTPGDGEFTNYRVRRGDTLSKIAKRHNTTVQAIMRANGKRSTVIRTGEQLKIPAPPVG